MKNSHYFSKEQNTKLEHIPIDFYLKKRRLNISLISSHGIFSKNKLDNGSNLLIDNCIIEDDWKILDLGCGYGPVGISLKIFNPTLYVDMCDINEKAIKIAKLNIKQKRLENIKAFNSNIFSNIKDKDYDTILLNPPQTAGKKICNEMIIKAKDHLKTDGILQIVARHQKGGKEFEKLMRSTYDNVKTIAKGSGYRIYISIKK